MKLRLLLPFVFFASLHANPVDDMKVATFEKDGTTLNYRWTRTGKSESPAFLLFLHGAGERGNDNIAQTRNGLPDMLAWLEKEGKDCVVLAPQCPSNGWWANYAGDFRVKKDLELKNEMSPVMSHVWDVMEKLRKSEKADSKRIYLTGLSMGGMGTFDLLSRKADVFAAAVPICGAGDLEQAKIFKDVPIWIFHGGADNVVPTDCSRDMVNALKKAGGTPKYTEYPGVAHDSWTATYKNPEVLTWIFEQVKK